MLIAVHMLHLISAVTWAGGLIYLSVVVYPMMARLPVAEARQVFAGVARISSPLMGVTGLLAFASGIARAWLAGVQAWGDLTSGYGLIVATAFGIAFFWLGGVDGLFRRRFRLTLRDDAAFAAGARRMARGNALRICGGVVVVLALMGALRLGLY